MYCLGGIVRLREEFGTPIVDWEILHGGVGGDVELGARTSNHILVFAFDPISLNSLSLIFVQASFLLSYHSYHILLAFVPCIIHIAISFICLVVCVCLTCT